MKCCILWETLRHLGLFSESIVSDRFLLKSICLLRLSRDVYRRPTTSNHLSDYSHKTLLVCRSLGVQRLTAPVRLRRSHAAAAAATAGVVVVVADSGRFVNDREKSAFVIHKTFSFICTWACLPDGSCALQHPGARRLRCRHPFH